MKQNFFAVDLGATSGRTILGTFIEGGLNLEEINRFPNHLIEVGGHFYWDIYALYRHIIDGLKLVARRGESIASIGIDTWGWILCVSEKTETCSVSHTRIVIRTRWEHRKPFFHVYPVVMFTVKREFR